MKRSRNKTTKSMWKRCGSNSQYRLMRFVSFRFVHQVHRCTITAWIIIIYDLIKFLWTMSSGVRRHVSQSIHLCVVNVMHSICSLKLSDCTIFCEAINRHISLAPRWTSWWRASGARYQSIFSPNIERINKPIRHWNWAATKKWKRNVLEEKRNWADWLADVGFVM